MAAKEPAVVRQPPGRRRTMAGKLQGPQKIPQMDPPSPSYGATSRRMNADKISRQADFLRRPAAPQLWRTSRPISPFSYVGQGRKGPRGLEHRFTQMNSGRGPAPSFRPPQSTPSTSVHQSPLSPHTANVSIRGPAASLAHHSPASAGRRRVHLRLVIQSVSTNSVQSL
jgi:hypothetical protein